MPGAAICRQHIHDWLNLHQTPLLIGLRKMIQEKQSFEAILNVIGGRITYKHYDAFLMDNGRDELSNPSKP